eukprot:2901132-Prymnesium_polylepis.1
MLAQDGQTHCYRTTSQPIMGALLIYLFMLVGVVMLVNMLIAMMAKTFDLYHGSTMQYLFVRARTINYWIYAETAIPPFNVFSVPHHIARGVAVLRNRTEQASTNRFRPEKDKIERLWMGGVEELVQEVSRYATSHLGESKRMTTKSITRDMRRLKFSLDDQRDKIINLERSLTQKIDERFDDIARKLSKLATQEANERVSDDEQAASGLDFGRVARGAAAAARMLNV